LPETQLLDSDFSFSTHHAPGYRNLFSMKRKLDAADTEEVVEEASEEEAEEEVEEDEEETAENMEEGTMADMWGTQRHFLYQAAGE
jgi:hypothetical protein